MNILIDIAGRSVAVGKRNAAVAIAKFGYIHVRSVDHPLQAGNRVDRTVIVTLQPRLSSALAVAALGYKVADLNPDRTIVIADLESPQSWVFSEYLPALCKVAALVQGGGVNGVSSAADLPARLS